MMEQTFHRRLRDSESPGKILVANLSPFHGQVTMQNFVNPPATLAFTFHPKPAQGLVRDRRGPTGVE
jgi:hypothetical protein